MVTGYASIGQRLWYGRSSIYNLLLAGGDEWYLRGSHNPRLTFPSEKNATFQRSDRFQHLADSSVTYLRLRKYMLKLGSERASQLKAQHTLT